MANRKKEVYKPKPMTEGKRNLIQGLFQEYDIQSDYSGALGSSVIIRFRLPVLPDI